MEEFIIEGGNHLRGELIVNGAKNHALKMIPAALLSAETTVISNVPYVEDVLRLLEILEDIGCTVNRSADHVVSITPPVECNGELSFELAPRIRASVVLLGPLLGRYGAVHLPHPGGDKIGRRPIDFFVSGLQAVGAEIEEFETSTRFIAPNGLTGATIMFPFKSVTATEALLLAATQANGVTVLKNAACEPEIVALAEYLNSVGACILGAGTHTITIEGPTPIAGGQAVIIPDRIEAGSFIMLAAATRSDILVTHCMTAHLEVPLYYLRQMGIPMEITEHSVHVLAHSGDIQPVEIVTKEYPGFPTDLQSPMTMLLTQATGPGSVRETIFDGRLYFTDMLNDMGASIQLLDPYRVHIHGPSQLYGKKVNSPDVRAGLAMIIAGLLAKGTTRIQNIYQIDRGYENIEGRLQQIGASIRRVQSQ